MGRQARRGPTTILAMRHCHRRGRLAAVATFTLVAAAEAQVQWQQIDHVPASTGSIAYDAARDHFTVLTASSGIGPAETWEWHRVAGWTRRQPNNPPNWSGTHVMAHDVVRGVTVVLHATGNGLATFAETLEWDGTNWANVSPATQPPVRVGHAMTHDPGSGRVVMFGGEVPSGNVSFFADTWEWDGAAWTPRSALGPSGRSGHGLAYDSARNDVVLFGGRDALGARADTWTLTATGWSPRAGGPPGRFGHAMAEDVGRGRIVLFGGSAAANSYRDDTWEWNGSAWSQQLAAAPPAGRSNAGLAADLLGGGVVLIGGADASTMFTDVWRWDGLAWTRLENLVHPPGRHSHASTFDEGRGEMLVFGGVNNAILGDLWKWDGALWSEVTGPGPSPRTRAVMTYDAARGESVLFGGELPGATDQTWVWNGVLWAQRFAATPPPARMLHAMAYDRGRDRTVLFGGAGGTFLGDTWEWNGSNWLQRTVAGPTPRHGHGMAYDAGNQVTVLYGGTAAGFPFGTILADTWEWNGTAWTQRAPANSPGPRREFAMTYDSARDRVVIFGHTSIHGTWEWDGADWSLRPVPAHPPARSRTSLAFDSWRERVLLFGGQSAGPNHFDLWQFGPVTAATVSPFGSACPGTSAPAIGASGRPWLGDTVQIQLQNGPGNTLTVIWAGLSNAQYNGLPLPFDLTSAAMPGCLLLASIDANVFGFSNAQGEAAVALAVPNQPALLGLELHHQGAFSDPSANAVGISISHAITLRVGGR